mgnify:CR=1 FL=1|tara:strand:- start:652 stop:1293 length:642 start_codon:yes stop_codon:yes gene_type:complete
MESPFLNINSPVNCWKGYQRVPGTAKGAKGSCRKSPAKMVKGGGTKKVCLPIAKIRGMSKGEKQSVISAKRSAGAKGKYKRSSKSNVTGTKSDGLKDWVKQDWRQVANPELKCGEKAPTEKKGDVRRTIGKGKNFNKAKSTGTGGAAGGGMTQKGVNEYKSKNPGSNLKTAVTKKPSELKPGSKPAKRRKAFCARSKSWKSKRGLAARRRWNC